MLFAKVGGNETGTTFDVNLHRGLAPIFIARNTAHDHVSLRALTGIFH